MTEAQRPGYLAQFPGMVVGPDGPPVGSEYTSRMDEYGRPVLAYNEGAEGTELDE